MYKLLLIIALNGGVSAQQQPLPPVAPPPPQVINNPLPVPDGGMIPQPVAVLPGSTQCFALFINVFGQAVCLDTIDGGVAQPLPPALPPAFVTPLWADGGTNCNQWVCISIQAACYCVQ